ncbi:MAG: DUF169 domain-containing protein [Ignavibacteriaceae bacterium]|nr:DUF169 domain-containing protein [Ignavibacteriaceae bacterium]
MESRIAELIKLKGHPVAVLLSDEKPEDGIQFKENIWGCVASMLSAAASKGKTAFFDRKTYGCVGGGVGLGFGNTYEGFPIEYLLSTGKREAVDGTRRTRKLENGEHYIKTPELAMNFVECLPMRNVKEKYVLFKPLALMSENEKPKSVVFFVNPDQLSALVVLANYGRNKNDNVIAPWGAACQSVLFSYEEEEKEKPRAIIGFFDLTARKHVKKDILSFTIPYKMFLEMEGNVKGSFLEMEEWHEISSR